ncbi:cytochrome c peroxidase [Mesorhizobium sp. KR1-2]|uniref:cytochrome-c peroxidase n=1 Tax=Mesorhizobium sp. KR1-2 TaxID=3156609 RepID=UPI0032B49169
MRGLKLLSMVAALAAALGAGAFAFSSTGDGWTAQERNQIASLSLKTLPALAPDPSNPVAEDPRAATLGEALFFDTRLSGNGKVACSSCHLPERQFQDGTPLGKGLGQTARRTMPIAGTAHSPWLFWDGRADSQWAQALGPLESAVEHGADRTSLARLMVANYRDAYAELFGPLPAVDELPAQASPLGSPAQISAWDGMTDADRTAVNRVFANIGKAIAAYERHIMPSASRFDRYADALATGKSPHGILTPDETDGLRLFIGKGNCVNCHNGPLLTDFHFHNTGVPSRADLPADSGRAQGAQKVALDPFNCLGQFSDAAPSDCAELKYMQAEGEELLRAYKTPSLREVAKRSPYMHAGQFGSLRQVIAHYDAAPHAEAGHSELQPLGLTDKERESLVAFLQSLDQE